MKIQALQVGSIGTNCYILCDEAAKVCAVIDPDDPAEMYVEGDKSVLGAEVLYIVLGIVLLVLMAGIVH